MNWHANPRTPVRLLARDTSTWLIEDAPRNIRNFLGFASRCVHFFVSSDHSRASPVFPSNHPANSRRCNRFEDAKSGRKPVKSYRRRNTQRGIIMPPYAALILSRCHRVGSKVARRRLSYPRRCWCSLKASVTSRANRGRLDTGRNPRGGSAVARGEHDEVAQSCAITRVVSAKTINRTRLLDYTLYCPSSVRWLVRSYARMFVHLPGTSSSRVYTVGKTCITRLWSPFARPSLMTIDGEYISAYCRMQRKMKSVWTKMSSFILVACDFWWRVTRRDIVSLCW